MKTAPLLAIILAGSMFIAARFEPEEVEKSLTGGDIKTWIRKTDGDSTCLADTMVFRLNDHKYAHTDCQFKSTALTGSWTLQERNDDVYIKLDDKEYILDFYQKHGTDEHAMRLRIKGRTPIDPPIDVTYYSK